MTSTTDVPLSFPPGIVKGSTNATSVGRWTDAQMIRWIDDKLTPILGCASLPLTATFGSPVRALHTWQDNTGIVRTAVLCEKNLYVIETNLVIDITPAGGIVGPDSNITAGGYGDDIYDILAYGTARPNKVNIRAIGPAWKLRNWGENLLAMCSTDGRLLQWVPNVVGTPPAAAVAGAPISNRTFEVTPDRYVMLFGMGGSSNTFGWCNQEDITNWNFASISSTAGSFDIEPASPFIAAFVTKYGVIAFTATKTYAIRYVGVPYIYSYDELGGGSIPVTQGSIADAGGKAVWFSDSGFWQWDGYTVSFLSCPLLDWIKDQLDPSYTRYRFASMSNGVFPEVWWMFPEAGKTENSRVVVYNYVDGWWSIGQLQRSCGYTAAFNTYPVMSDGTRIIIHEQQNFYADYPVLPFVTSGPLNTKSGGLITSMQQMVVDDAIVGPNGPLYSVAGRIMRNGADPIPISVGPKTARADGKVDLRITARDLNLTIKTPVNGAPLWTFGQPILKIGPRGKR